MKKENADKFSKINCLLFLWNQDKKWRLFKRSLTFKKKHAGRKKYNNIFVAWIREHSYVTWAHFSIFSDSPTHYVSIDPVLGVSKNCHFLNPPIQPFCWRYGWSLTQATKILLCFFLLHIWLNINRINDSNLFIFKFTTNSIGRNILGNRTSSRRGNKIRLQLRLCTYKHR